MTCSMPSGLPECRMTTLQPAAVAMRAAVSFVDMPPVPHSVPEVLVSISASSPMSQTSGILFACAQSYECRLHFSGTCNVYSPETKFAVCEHGGVRTGCRALPLQINDVGGSLENSFAAHAVNPPSISVVPTKL